MSLGHFIIGAVLAFMAFTVICENRHNGHYHDHGKWFHTFWSKWYGWFVNLSIVLVFVSVIGFFVMLAGMIESTSFINRFEAAQQTMEQKGDFVTIERAAMFVRVMRLNGELRNYQYWNNVGWGTFDPFLNDGVDDLKPLRGWVNE